MVEKSSKSLQDAIPKNDVRSQILSISKALNISELGLSTEDKIFLPYGVGPDIDCEIDDEGDTPDYLSYSRMPPDEDEDSSKPGEKMPEKN